MDSHVSIVIFIKLLRNMTLPTLKTVVQLLILANTTMLSKVCNSDLERLPKNSSPLTNLDLSPGEVILLAILMLAWWQGWLKKTLVVQSTLLMTKDLSRWQVWLQSTQGMFTKELACWQRWL